MNQHKNWPVEDRRRAQRWEANFKGAVLMIVLLALGFWAGYSVAVAAEMSDHPDQREHQDILTYIKEIPDTPDLVDFPQESADLPANLDEPQESEEPNAVYVGEFTVSHYCCEAYAHICGTGDGITFTGTEVTAYRSCAVDPDVIPLGSEVQLHMADGRVLYYIAEDVGGAIQGNRIDLALPTHDEALRAGITTASVYVEVS